MYDVSLVKELLTQILDEASKILSRSEFIDHPDDFTGSPAGLVKLDAICMQIIAIGESLKNIDKITNN